MIHLLLFLLLIVQQDDIPLKPKDEFNVKIDYDFREKSNVSKGSTSTFDYTMMEDMSETKPSAPVSFATLNLMLSKLPNGESKIKVVDNKGAVVLNKKIKEGESYKIPLGFVDDMKGRKAAHEYNLVLINSDKKDVNRVHIFVKEDGVITVNGEQQ